MLRLCLQRGMSRAISNQTKTQPFFITRIYLQKIEKRNELISLTSLSYQSLSTHTQIINTDKHMQ